MNRLTSAEKARNLVKKGWEINQQVPVAVPEAVQEAVQALKGEAQAVNRDINLVRSEW